MLSQYKSLIQQAIGAKQVLSQRIISLAEKQQENILYQQAIEEAQVFLQGIAQDTQAKLQIHIEDIVQLALDTCFPGEYEFRVLFEIKRGSTECQLFFTKNEERVDPMDSSGGGAVDITSFALRIACKTLSTTRNTILLDEPFRFLSQDLQPKAAEILSELSHKLDIQFIIVTHNDCITEVADRVFDNRLVKSVSDVRVK